MGQNKKKNTLYLVSSFISRLYNSRVDVNRAKNFSLLLIKRDSLTGILAIIPLIKALKQQNPNFRITLFTLPEAEQICKRLPEILVESNANNLLEGTFDFIFDFAEDWKSIKQVLKFKKSSFFFSGSVRKFAHKNQLQLHETDIAKQTLAHFTKVEETLFNSPFFLIEKKEKQDFKLFLQRNVIDNYVVFYATSNFKLNRWSLSSFIEIANFIRNTYQLDLIWIGEHSEHVDIQKMQRKLGFETFFYELKSPTSCLALFEKAKLAICHESIWLHLATLQNTPTIGLYGPGNPNLDGPFTNNVNIIHEKMACNPCDRINCIYPQNPCMNRISVNSVIETVKKLVTL